MKRPRPPYTLDDIAWLMRPLPPPPPPLPPYSEGMKLTPYLDELDFYAAAAGLPTSSRLDRFIARYLDSPFSCWWERKIERAEAWLHSFEPWLDRQIAKHEPPPPRKSATIIPFPARPRQTRQRLRKP